MDCEFEISFCFFCQPFAVTNFVLVNNRYQMNPANYREALIEAREDEAEGADILLVSSLSSSLSETFLEVW